MEIDIKERAKRIEEKRTKSEILKNKGNNLMKENKIQEAADC